MSTLLHRDLGRLDYLEALSLQETIVAFKQRGPSPDLLLFVEHPHVYTTGRGGKLTNVLDAPEVPVYRSGRGGDVTYHGPGQLVVYPIVDLRSKLRRDVHRYVRTLEMTAILTLRQFSIEANRKPPYTGIWIENRKIAAIGVAVRRCITFHGLALNVNTDLHYFQGIVPCGLTWAGVTSMRQELGAEQNFNDVKKRFLSNFAALFGHREVREEFDGAPQNEISPHGQMLGTFETLNR
jgi:lipoate-protein ligase B